MTSSIPAFSSIYITAGNALASAEQAFNRSAEDIANNTTGDFTTDLIGAMKAQQAFEANAQIVRTATEMFGSLLDMFDTDNR